MSRARFAKAVGQSFETRERASVREALWFDIEAPDTADDSSLSDSRSSSLDHSAFLLLATHLVLGSACIGMDFGAVGSYLVSAALPLALILALDAAAAFGLHRRLDLELPPHTVSRAMCVYLAAIGFLWALFGVAVMAALPGHAAIIAVAVYAGIAMMAVVSISSPPLAIVNAFVATGATAFFSRSPLIPVGVALLSFFVIAYSVAGARTVIAAGRRRLNLDAEARKALNFVDEFENSGRGWFWETNPEGTLSYVSQQLADDFKCEPAELLGRQFTDLLSVETDNDGAIEERKTLGFHLSARFPFSDVIVRAASDQDTGRYRETRSSTSAADSSASAESVPTSPSSAGASRRFRGWRGSIR